MAYGSFVLMRDLNFTVRRGDIFIIMGGSGCGKSTLLRHLIGLKEPATGEILYDDVNFTKAEPEQREQMLRRFGILYQSGALWSSMTLAENVGLPLGEFTDLSRRADPRDRVAEACAGRAQGLRGFLPQSRSAAACKSAPAWRARWRWIPEILFFDEPSAGLDPISSRLLDDLILELRDSLGATIVVVTHELASIFAIANNSVFLDAESRTQIATGDPHEMLAQFQGPARPAISDARSKKEAEQQPVMAKRVSSSRLSAPLLSPASRLLVVACGGGLGPVVPPAALLHLHVSGQPQRSEGRGAGQSQRRSDRLGRGDQAQAVARRGALRPGVNQLSVAGDLRTRSIAITGAGRNRRGAEADWFRKDDQTRGCARNSISRAS